MSKPRRNLVVVRAGDASLHRGWIAGPQAPEFDLIVSYFGDDPTAYRSPAERRVDFKGGKWNGIADLFARDPDLLNEYDYFWLPDDDIETDTATVNGIFAAMREHGLDLAQPSLTVDSHYTYLSFLKCAPFAVRYTSAVEIMAPCVRASLLRKALPFVANSPSGWGLDAVWTRLGEENARRSAILDLWSVKHTRPVGKVLNAAIAKAGGNQWDDLARMREAFGKSRLYPLIYEAIDASGERWKSGAAIGLRMAVHYGLNRARMQDRALARRDVFKLVRRQAAHAPDLSRLTLAKG